MSEPHVTIIILHWRAFERTAQCLASLAHLEYDAYSILVADNGSHDGSLERLRRAFPQIDTLEYDENRGFAAGVNPAIRRALDAGSEYMLLLNNDVLVEPDLLTQLIAAATSHREFGILSPKTVWTDRPDRLAGLGCRVHAFDIETIGWDVADTLPSSATPVSIPCVFGSAMLVSRRVFETIGVFDERYFFYYEDVDFCVRAQMAGVLTAFVPNITVRHGVSASSRSIRGLRDFYLARSRQLFFRKHRTGVMRALYVGRELFQVPRTVRIRLKEGSPSNALGYLAGALVGLVMPVYTYGNDEA